MFVMSNVVAEVAIPTFLVFDPADDAISPDESDK